jgi:hypothetical protein
MYVMIRNGTEQNISFISDLYIVHHHIHNYIQVTCTFQCNQYKEINNINNIKKFIIVMKLQIFVTKPQRCKDEHI